MDETLASLEAVTLELEDETIEAVDEKAFTEHRGNRNAALRDLLDEWLKTRDWARCSSVLIRRDVPSARP